MEVAARADLRGKVALVTGASSGIGVETARALATAGADLVLAVRSPDAGEAVAAVIREQTGRRVVVGVLDLCDFASVLAFVERFLGTLSTLDLLVANAGASKTPQTHQADAIDVRFAGNHLGHFLLARLLLAPMAARGARIVVVSSAAHKGRPVCLDDLCWRERPHDIFAAYGESKTANILFAMEATRRWADRGIFVNAVLPGTIMTGLQRYHDDALMRTIGFVDDQGRVNPAVRSVEQGAATSVWAATAPELQRQGGLVLEDCAEARPITGEMHPWTGVDPAVLEPNSARRLWEASERILNECGVSV